MKKLLIFAAVAGLLGLATGCGSLRTPASGSNSNKVYYQTFYGISFESLVYGDGLIVK